MITQWTIGTFVKPQKYYSLGYGKNINSGFMPVITHVINLNSKITRAVSLNSKITREVNLNSKIR